MLALGLPSLICGLSLLGSVAAVDPNAIYRGTGSYNTTNSTVTLRIGNGGAGQSGLVKGEKQPSKLDFV